MMKRFLCEPVVHFVLIGALSEIGLPQGRIPAALLFFNLGVEVGQLMFVACALSLIVAVQRTRIPIPRAGGLIPPYALGCVGMFWIIDRVAGF